MVLTRPVFIRLCRARELLEEPTEPLASVRDIARDVGISPFHFIRQFEAVIGFGRRLEPDCLEALQPAPSSTK